MIKVMLKKNLFYVLSVLSALAGLECLSSKAFAVGTIALKPLNGGALGNSGQFFYFSAYNGVVPPLAPSSFISFNPIDIFKRQDTDTNFANVIRVQLSSTATQTLVSPQQAVIMVFTTVLGVNYPMPIAGVNGNPCSPTNSAGCQALGLLGTYNTSWPYYYTVPYAPTTTVEVDLYPSDFCNAYVLAKGGAPPSPMCAAAVNGNGTVLASPVPGTPISIPLTFILTTVTDALPLTAPTPTPSGAPFDTLNSTTSSLNFVFQVDSPSFACPGAASLNSGYFPGDGNVFINTSLFGMSTSPGAAPASLLWVVAQDSSQTAAQPVVGPTFAGGTNSLVCQPPQPFGVVNASYTGFQNSTPASVHNYTLGFLGQDDAGIYAFSSPACVLGPVQTASIQGYLKQNGCFIATAAFGSDSILPVLLLREFRDEVLDRFDLGRDFISWYYSWSPAAADWLTDHPVLRYPVLLALAPLELVAWLCLHPVFLLAYFFLSTFFLVSFRLSSKKGVLVCACLGVPALLFLASQSALAADNSVNSSDQVASQPYIEKQKRKMEKAAKEKGEPSAFQSSESYTERMKQKLQKQDAERETPLKRSEGYTEQQRRKLDAAAPIQPVTPGSETSYTEQEKKKLAPEEEKSAIQDYKEGKSRKLEAQIPKFVHNSFGLRYGVSLTRNITASSAYQAHDFQSVYGANYSPDVSLYYEYKIFHHDYYGSLGIMGMFGVGYFSGQGLFGSALTRPDGTPFSQTSQTNFQFFTIPVTLAVRYQIQVLKFLLPFAAAGPTVIGYEELRDDNGPTLHGYSKAIYTSVGTAILLDWISGRDHWDQYADNGIKHMYLTVEYSRMMTFSGNVSFTISGVFLGFAFDF